MPKPRLFFPVSFVRATSLVTLIVFVFSTLAVPYSEASFWSERRRAAENIVKESDSPSAVLAQLPRVASRDLSALSALPPALKSVVDASSVGDSDLPPPAAAPWMRSLLSSYGEVRGDLRQRDGT